jgi:lysyl-tRNA synthetase class II
VLTIFIVFTLANNFTRYEDDKEVKLSGCIKATQSAKINQKVNEAPNWEQSQLCISKKELDIAGREILRELNAGDYVGVTGEVLWTKNGESHVKVQTLNFMAKALNPCY